MYVVRYTKVHKITQTYNKMTRINKYHQLLIRILNQSRHQQNKKGGITYLVNEQLSLTPGDLLEIFETHGIARKKLKAELSLYMAGECDIERYRAAGIDWWDYCGQTLINSYPTYMAKLPVLIDRINRERRSSKNYVLFLGATEAPTNQAPCLSLIQYQIEEGELVISAYQRSSDASLGLPSDLYHLYLMSRQIELPLRSITLNLGNVHIYDTNIEATRRMLDGEEGVKYTLNV
jgi:Thymidylate synthase